MDDARREGGLVLVAGEPGAGKTRLVAELAERASRRGEIVVYGRCDPRAPIPYEPFVEALRTGYGAGLPAAPTAARRAYLARLLPELSDEPPVAPGGEDDAERLRLFDAVAMTLKDWAADNPLLLVLDDLHWAEPSTLQLLRYLLREAESQPLAVLGTLREPDPDRGEGLPAALIDVRRRHPLHEVRLGGLDSGGVEELIAAWTGRPASTGLSARLLDYTAGNPFYLRSTLRELTSVPDAGPTHGERALPVPADVREIAMRRVDALGDEPRALLRAGAIFGRDFALDEARVAAGLGVEATVEAADLATATGLAHQLDEIPVRLSFEHELVRRALLESTTPSRRALLHRRVAEVIEAAGAPESRTGELAMHYGSALSLATAGQALRFARLAAEYAGRQYAFDEQARYLELALQALLAAGKADPLERYELLMELGLAQYRATGPDTAHSRFAEAADLAERLGDPERIARAALGAGLERYLRHIGVVEADVVELLGRALGALGDDQTALAVRVRSALLLERVFLDPLERRSRDADEAVALAARTGDPHALLDAETVRQVVVWHPKYTEELLARVPRLAAEAHALGRLDIPIHLHCTAFGYAIELNRREDLDRHFEAADAAAEGLRTPIHRIRVDALSICRTIVDSRFAEAQAAIDSALPMMIDVHADLAVQLNALWTFMLMREQGRLADLRETFEAIVAAAPALPAARALLGEICARTGDLDAAGGHLDVLAEHDFDDIHDDFGWLAVLTSSATVAALIGDRTRSARLYELLAPWAGRNVITGVAANDRPVCFSLGLLAGALGRTDD
ncbi:MAG: eukaryotic-like serine/threonine-protein kinase, partial [Thermoleophilaceae bacterium]|nr:eukaryotic-like serine/threonine-protein kinase [Thermoleophilaceae bacterium]